MISNSILLKMFMNSQCIHILSNIHEAHTHNIDILIKNKHQKSVKNTFLTNFIATSIWPIRVYVVMVTHQSDL